MATDFDGEARPAAPDLGADQFGVAGQSFIPRKAPSIIVPLDGPATLDVVNPNRNPAANSPVSPPGDMVQPSDINGRPLDLSLNQDGNGDGINSNDTNYFALAAGDGFAKMADGTELYTFGFSDVTGLPHDAVFTEGLLNANLCAPTMRVQQGNDFYIDLSNVGMLMRPDLFDPHTVHFHGFPQAASVFDGEPMASIAINMGGTLRYFYRLAQPGTYFYHCHVEATEHMQMGMIGNLWVNPRQNYVGYGANTAATRAKLGGNTNAAAPLGYAYNDADGSTAYDVEAPIQITGFDRFFHEQHVAVQPLPFSTLHDDYPMINGRGYPDTINTNVFVNSVGKSNQKINALVRAKVGQRVLLRISCVSESDYYTVSVPGIPMRVIAKDARMLRTANITANNLGETANPTGSNLSYRTMSVSLGGGETSDVILDTARVKPGTYVLYTTRANFLSNGPEDFGGLMTEIILEP